MPVPTFRMAIICYIPMLEGQALYAQGAYISLGEDIEDLVQYGR